MSLEVRHLTVGYYADIHILQGVNLQAESSRITIIIGANGVGKSTLLKTICGFLKPTEGRILFDGGDITGISPHRVIERGISYIPQRRNVFPYLSIEANWELGAWTFRKDRKKIRDLIDENFERFATLKPKRDLNAGSLSGGEQRMVEIGRSLMVDPVLMLVDEPTAGLAPMVAREIYERLSQLNSDEDKTILLVDQNIRQAMKIADYIYVLELGKNRSEGSREEFESDLKGMIRDWLL
jgi:branched-chain amino acid transport system ATP-binding protein